MAAELKVGISADPTDLEQGLNQAKKAIIVFDKTLEQLQTQLKSLEKGLKSASNQESFDRISRAIEVSKDRIANFGKTAPQELKKVGVSFQGTARVIQDAAFGPAAIANNLEGLSNDFKQLSRNAKESGQSIGKTLVQSLAGGGGLNLALSGLTLGLSLASFGLSAWTRLFGENEKAVKSDVQALDDYANSLNAVSKATLQGSRDAQREITDLKLLFGAYQNANLPLKERKEAYKQLQELYPSYFGNLQFEETASTKTKDAYNKLTSSILESARARAAANLIAENASKQLVIEQQIADIEAKRPNLIRAAANAQKALQQAQQLETGGDGAINIRAIQRQASAQQKVEESIGSTIKLQAEHNRLNEENKKLIDSVNASLLKGGSIIDGVNNNIEAEFEKIQALEPIKGLGSGIVDALSKDLKDNKGKLNNALADLLSVDPTLFSIISSDLSKALNFNVLATPNLDFSALKGIAAKVQANLAPTLDVLEQFNTNAGNILKQGAITAFNELGTSIGNALAEGTSVLEAAGSGLLSALGGVLIQLGELAIATGIGIKAIQTALASLNPFVAIAAGVGLIALGTLVKGKAKALSGNFAGGGGGGTTTGTPGSGFAPSAPVVFGSGQQSGVIIAETQIKGNDLSLILKRTNGLNSRMGA